MAAYHHNALARKYISCFIMMIYNNVWRYICVYYGYRPDSVHADLSELVAVHQPSLLQAYRNGNIFDEIKDQYFQRSNIIPKMDHIVEPSVMRSATCVPFEPVSAPAAIPSNFPASQTNKSRVKCPLCRVSWASVQKVNMKTHLMKYHGCLIDQEAVRKFTQQYSISLK